jgi:hypothetical protein
MPKRPSTECCVRSMSGVHVRPVEWLWPGWIPLGKLTVLDGDPGVGKSTLLFDLAARLSRDGVMPDGAAGPLGAALLLSAEDGVEDTIRPRLEAAGGVAGRLFTLPAVRGDDGHMRPPEVPLDLPAIDAAVRQYGARLVVIDPLMAFLTGADASVDQEVRRALFRLSRLAERRECAVVCLRHLFKAGGDKAVYRGGGSIGIVAAARSALVAAADTRRGCVQTAAPVSVHDCSIRVRTTDPCRAPWQPYGLSFGPCDAANRDGHGGLGGPNTAETAVAHPQIRHVVNGEPPAASVLPRGETSSGRRQPIAPHGADLRPYSVRPTDPCRAPCRPDGLTFWPPRAPGGAGRHAFAAACGLGRPMRPVKRSRKHGTRRWPHPLHFRPATVV